MAARNKEYIMDIDIRPYQRLLKQGCDKASFDCYREPIDWFLEQSLRSDSLPIAIRRNLQGFWSDRRGVYLLSGSPLDQRLFDTGDIQKKGTRVTENFIAQIASRLGVIIGYAQESDGQLIHQIIPDPGAIYAQTSKSSEAELMFHSENAFSNEVDAVILLGLRDDHEKSCITYVSHIDKIMEYLSAPVINVLFEQEFAFKRIDESFGGGQGPICSVFQGDKRFPTMRFDEDLMIGTTDRAKAALIDMKQAVHLARIPLRLTPGTLAVIDNWLVAHSRSIYKARFDGLDRWLQRALVSRRPVNCRFNLKEHQFCINRTDYSLLV